MCWRRNIFLLSNNLGSVCVLGIKLLCVVIALNMASLVSKKALSFKGSPDLKEMVKKI